MRDLQRPLVIVVWALIHCLLSANSSDSIGRAEDWPTFGHDARRSQTTSETIDFASLQLQWVRQATQPPLAAWGQPAMGDAFANLRDLPSMRNYDPVWHPIVVGNSAYVGSNVDDTLRCIDLQSGLTQWTHTVGGPIRIAPTHSKGRIYFGADDGAAYCVDASTGKRIWKFRPSEQEPDGMVLNNGRLISYWPCRSGVLVDEDTAWFTCSLLPWRHSYLCSVDALTGQPTGPGRYVQRLDKVTLEGPLVASQTLLFSPQGRESPLQFQRSDGKFLGALGQSGYGVFCVLTPDNRLLHGPRARRGGLADSQAETRAPVAVHRNARAMIVTEKTSYLLSDDVLAATRPGDRKVLWSRPVSRIATMLVAGPHLVLGGTDRVQAIDRESGETVWSRVVDGRAFGLVAAQGGLLASTDTGKLYRFGPHVDQASSAQVAAPARRANGEEQSAPSNQAKPIPALEVPGLLGRWVCSPSGANTRSPSRTQIKNQAGGLPATLTKPPAWREIDDETVLHLDDSHQGLLISDKLDQARLPRRELAAEAWVRIDKSQEWGGIVGVIQDNGSYERGWLLGFRRKKFTLAVVGDKANKRITYLHAAEDFELRRWYHVVGTYDGTSMRLYVDGREVASSDSQKGHIAYPPAAFYVVGAYRDDNERYPMRGMLHEVRVYDRALTPGEIQQHTKSKSLGSIPSFKPDIGPWVNFDSSSSAVVHWRTKSPLQSIVEWTDAKGRKQSRSSGRTTNHAVRIDNLGRDRRLTYRIVRRLNDNVEKSQSYPLDTYFNFQLAPSPKPGPDQPGPAAVEDQQPLETATHLAKLHGNKAGLCFVVGADNFEIARRLAGFGQLRVVGWDDDLQRIANARRQGVESKRYGPRLTFQQISSQRRLPAPDHCVNMLVVPLNDDHAPRLPLTEIRRLLRPEGGVVAIVSEQAAERASTRRSLLEALRSAKLEPLELPSASGKLLAIGRRGRLPGAGQWTHMYGDASNAAFGGEKLAGVKTTRELAVAWFGRPGPRYQTDRQNRKSSPLYAGGRLYLQGQERIIALDAYNGVILWSLEVPGLLRFNIPRDASNWCCDERFLYVAHNDRCLQIDGDTGEVVTLHPLESSVSGTSVAGVDPTKTTPEPSKAVKNAWGYLARSENLLLGSSVVAGSSFQEFWGKDFWFDQKSGPYTHQVCSDRLFARHLSSGTSAWEYRGGKIWNATLTIGDGRVYFVESRHPSLSEQKTGRLGVAELYEQTTLVALDLATGRTLWERPLKIQKHVLLANVAFGSNALVLQTSADNRFPIRAFDPETGRPLWETKVSWPRNHHGGHLSRPAIVNNQLFVRPSVIDLRSGKVVANNLPGGGCGTYACAEDALFFRSGSGGMLSAWNAESGSYTHWHRLRPDCWLSSIPAGGMLLSPEGGGGCSCGRWMETSVGFQPRSVRSEP